jgi:hypothetical protein
MGFVLVLSSDFEPSGYAVVFSVKILPSVKTYSVTTILLVVIPYDP